jgi:cytochrome c biogenesis protein ResB
MGDVYRQPFFRILIGLMGLSTFSCTLRKRRSVSWPVMVVHSGVIITLIGGMTSWLGFVATVNAYEGDRVEKFFRWDIEKESSLGFTMNVKRINTEFYPTPIKVGVMKGEEKKQLFVLKTGESFDYDSFRVTVDRLEPVAETLYMTVYNNGKELGKMATDGTSNMPPEFPFNFKLVAFQNPILKRMWVNLSISDKSGLLVDGTSEVNAPLMWNGLYFYNTQISHDPSGKKFAGIQIVKDPGRPIVFAGLIITTLGGILAFARKKVWN